jgi:hypothetical protein
MAVKLSFDVPETLELQFPEGLKVSSRFGGDQIMFSLTNGEKFYTDEFVASKIKAAGIGANQPFNIVKRAIVNGNRRMVEYEIEPLLEPKQISDPRPTVYAGESRNGKNTAVVLGAGVSVPEASAAAAPPPPPSSVAIMKLAGMGAIDAVLEIEQYAQSRGMTDFNFGADNIQKIVACLFIEMSKKAAR